ncbi:Y4yA family PLP-dependent enzyme [Leeuwenhoekiella marinoflava]|uniref:Diaminopimelate decarboxylase n=2 Tax=Leeuwenhoekiella marinoflava TaxID=988 RepID=A0A4Q0PNQ3_9FLAO|nr:Y4yA family PLP-dependent enzyme [Leeuwenhoekiella marinoflava]RXG30007.1 diaminopimelate decarboxylase [Leeuwenhoekiella marinoflava]SHF23619.1 diaminopimelate decarboxylase [Leeuwenhoekiella marinoflava DSM 3653]
MKNNLPQLEPLTSDWMLNIIQDTQLQKELFEAYQSPLNIHNLPAFEENCKEYQKVLSTYGFKSKVFFARKANKFKNLINAAISSGIGVDTASFRELEQGVNLQLNPDNLISTAAIKNRKLLKLAISNRVLIVVDNEDELDQIFEISQDLNTKAKIAIRISGFEYKGNKLMSRFGFDVDAVEEMMLHYFKDSKRQQFNVEGFHFHLDGYSTGQRGEALHQTLDLLEKLNIQGFNFSFIDIGGGILMNYLKHETQWIEFQKHLKDAVLGNRNAITYNNDGLGFTIRNGTVEGKLATYPYYNKQSKGSFLKKLLGTENKSHKPVYQRLEDLDVELRLEPGRSLLNQVGITAARVVHRKIDARGNHLIGLEMNMSQLKSSSADFLLDPFVGFQNPRPDAQPVEVYFTGAYCLERDVLLKRKIELPQLPEPGDTIIFVNTAGYMMHFFETEAHLFERAINLAVAENKTRYQIADFEEES